MKIIFAGTPQISAAVLQALIDNKHEVVAVLTQPDRPQGRGLKLTQSFVKIAATHFKIPVLQPATLKDPNIEQQLREFNADLMIVLAYGLILPKTILEIPKHGCINIHASLLPRWRGASPIQHAILAGDKETGITIMQMDTGMDTGDILATYPCKIGDDYTTEKLLAVLTDLAQTAILDCLHKLKAYTLHPVPQNNALATYAPKITKQNAQINWRSPAIHIDRMVRAFNPWPVAFTQLHSQTIRIWQAKELPETKPYVSATPGTIIDINKQGIVVATGEGSILLQTLQLPGKKPLPAREIANSHQEIANGAIFT